MTLRTGRIAAVTMLVTALSVTDQIPPAAAISPPSVNPASVPADGRPGPEQPMRQSNICAQAIAAPQPTVTLPAPGFTMLNIDQAWQFSTGHGVSVAVIDTGINPHPRLPVTGGGDYITGGDGLSDCDAHGTVVASVIAAAPNGTPMPRPMPQRPAFPPLAGQSPPVPQPGPRPTAVPDGLVGVAPHATLIAIRQSSRAFQPQSPGVGDLEARRKAGTVSTLARAIVHAANLGAKVINVSVASCVSAADPLDQSAIGAAVWYAATSRDAVIVAAAGNAGEENCAQNPSVEPLGAQDPRGWSHVRTVSSPSWFSDYVLSVGAVDPTGMPIDKSLAGPWVGVAAPAVGIIGLSAQTGGPVNAYPPARPGEPDSPFWGTSFAAAYVSGVAALVRARYPELSARQVIERIQRTAHNPARGVDNQVGYGVVDPTAALTFNVPTGPRTVPGAQTRVITPPAAPPPPDHRARNVAVAFTLTVMVGTMLAAAIARARRARRAR